MDVGNKTIGQSDVNLVEVEHIETETKTETEWPPTYIYLSIYLSIHIYLT